MAGQDCSDFSKAECGSVSGAEPEPVDTPKSSSPLVADKTVRPSSPARRTGGPKTAQGKERSKRNARKHGIFSELVLLPGESRREYQSLLQGLQDYFEPEGTAEVVLVEKFAYELQCFRRYIDAERAEIRMGVSYHGGNVREPQVHLTDKHITNNVTHFVNDPCWKIRSPVVLDCVVGLLGILRDSIERNGFDSIQDMEFLEGIYGGGKQEFPAVLVSKYKFFDLLARIAGKRPLAGEFQTPEKCRDEFLRQIDHEINLLKSRRDTLIAIEADRSNLERHRRLVPDSPHLDRLLRYKASLERSIDRTLTQLERLQRMRRGQPIPAPLKVDLSI